MYVKYGLNFRARRPGLTVMKSSNDDDETVMKSSNDDDETVMKSSNDNDVTVIKLSNDNNVTVIKSSNNDEVTVTNLKWRWRDGHQTVKWWPSECHELSICEKIFSN